MNLESKKESNLAKKLIKYFVQGLFYIVPIAVTIYVIVYLILLIDGIVNLDIPGLGLLIILVGVTLIGFIGTYFLAYFKPFDRAIESTPLIKLIYTSMKDLMNAFVGKKNQFKKPVLVKMGGDFEAERIGFMTKEDLSDIGIGNDKAAVYFPFSYAISGQVYIVPKKNISPIDASSSDIMKLIVSGGVTSIEKNKNKHDEKNTF
ncbi:MAG: DUF502 domain-containing protein [Bacteroidetes bacterium]|nr:MAG: DUF502 domain-containing protein [Bacteroidota bacterium]MBL1143732.1 DUF502 domain-containing protein [Bacteroidota bacterium]MCB0802486.1 DUF502 domain-containing protein [Flavobacteriales bacterium]NOG56534.1 DUF502 domain-containing protein [Bacteroidota bacterium]